MEIAKIEIKADDYPNVTIPVLYVIDNYCYHFDSLKQFQEAKRIYEETGVIDGYSWKAPCQIVEKESATSYEAKDYKVRNFDIRIDDKSVCNFFKFKADLMGKGSDTDD